MAVTLGVSIVLVVGAAVIIGVVTNLAVAAIVVARATPDNSDWLAGCQIT